MRIRAGVVVLLLILAALAACTDNPAVRSRYEAEKRLFQAERTARQAGIRQRPGDTSLSDPTFVAYDTTVRYCYAALKRFPASQYPGENRELAAITYKASNRMVGMTYRRQRYDSCVQLLERMTRELPLDRLGTVTTYLNLGSALQSAGNWDSALVVFNYSLEKFYPPVDDKGEVVINLLNLPTHIYDVYLKIGDTATALEHAKLAEQYYRQLIADHPGTVAASAGHLNLASLYERLQRWDEAIAELAFLTDASNTATSARLRIASIQASYLGHPNKAIDEYDRILSSLQGRDTLNRPMVMFNKGLVYLHQGQYSEARSILVDVKQLYHRFYSRMPTVQFAIARSFELQGNWDRAETEYKFLISNFPTSEQSLSTYLYLIDQYKERDRLADAERLETRAETVYDEIAADYAGSPAEAAALSYKAELLRRRQQWHNAATMLTDVFDRFPASEIGFRDMVTAATIYRDDLKQPKVADSLIQELKRRLTTIDQPGEI